MLKAHQRWGLVAVTSAILAYCLTSRFGFVFDDRKQVLENSTLAHLGSIPGYFSHPGGYLVGDFSYYRPLFGVWTNLNYFMFGLHPSGWHIALLLLHAFVVFLCFHMLLALLGDVAAAATGALIFAVHPIHVESVAWISGSTDPLAAAFLLVAFLSYLKAREKPALIFFSWLAFAASLLCKETALIFPFLILSYALLLGDENQRKLQSAVKSAAPYFAVTAIYTAVRIHVLGGFSHTLTPLPLKVVLLTLPSIVIFYLGLLLAPTGLSPFYDTPYIKTASVTGFLAPTLILLMLGGILTVWVLHLRKSGQAKASRQVVFFLAWTIFLLVPAFNLTALDIGEIAHDRYLYLPSIGVCALIALVMKGAGERLHLSVYFRNLAVAAVAIILCTATIAQSVFWKDDMTLYKRGASMAPANMGAQSNLANTYFEAGDFEHGIAVYKRILMLDPSFVNSYYNLGVAYYKLGDHAQAQSYLQKAISLRPTPGSYFYLGLAQLKKGDLASAQESLRVATQWSPERFDFHAALAVVYEAEGKLPLALQEFEQALSLNLQNQTIRNEIAKIKAQLGQT
ncbi:MAG: tetratricopeptide repeat protein [Candidatus Angelobacter sp.]